MNFNQPNEPRIVYMGTPEISAVVLRGLLEAGYNVVGLITNEDKAVGRKRVLEPTPTKKVALEYGIPVFQPHRIRLDHDFLDGLKPDVIVTMAYGQLVPQEVLSCPKYGCINLHGSLLPKYRGAAPIQRAIMAGETETGITLMEMVMAMDAGRMYAKKSVAIEENDNYTSLCGKLALCAKDLILETLMDYLNGLLPGQPQNEEEVTFAAKILPEDEHLDLNLDKHAFLNQIRGLSLTPGGYLYLGALKFKIYEAEIASDEVKGPVGKIFVNRKGVDLQVKDGLLRLKSVQLEGKKTMDGASFANGYHPEWGDELK